METGYDEDDNEIDVTVKYDKEWFASEPDVGQDAGYGAFVISAEVESTGEPYDFSDRERDNWECSISESL